MSPAHLVALILIQCGMLALFFVQMYEIWYLGRQRQACLQASSEALSRGDYNASASLFRPYLQLVDAIFAANCRALLFGALSLMVAFALWLN